VIHI